MSVRSRLAFTFGGLAFLVLLVAAISIDLLLLANDRFEDYVTGINARAAMTARVRAAVDQRAISARNLVLTTKDSDREQEKQLVAQAHAQATESLAQLQQLASASNVPEQVRQMIAEIAKIEKSYAPVALAIVDLAIKGDHQTAIQKLNTECRPLLAALIKATDDYATFTATRSQGLIQEAEETYAWQRNALIAVSLLALLLAVGAGYFITQNLWRELGAEPSELRQIVNRVAQGDLSSTVQLEGVHEDSVLAIVNQMQASLTKIVTFVRLSAENVSTASSQISSSNQDLSRRTESQASALEETASSMEQLSATIQQNANNAQHADKLALSASEVAAHGGEVVSKVVETMQGINDSSRRIADIIGVIDGIAFQTNILALNAAVEAARAGEQGRGFAVVASEVRSLAGRSAEAAREIKSLISASVERVEQGAVFVEDAGKTMTDIVSGTRQVASIIGEISKASHDQSHGVLQVGEAVRHMDRATQQNAAMVEEMAAAASEMQRKAQDLVETVSMFKLSPG